MTDETISGIIEDPMVHQVPFGEYIKQIVEIEMRKMPEFMDKDFVIKEITVHEDNDVDLTIDEFEDD